MEKNNLLSFLINVSIENLMMLISHLKINSVLIIVNLKIKAKKEMNFLLAKRNLKNESFIIETLFIIILYLLKKVLIYIYFKIILVNKMINSNKILLYFNLFMKFI